MRATPLGIRLFARAGGVHAYRYLKLNVTDTADGTSMGVSEVQILENVGGPNKALGATYSDSDHFSGSFTAANAFDGNTSTDYASAATPLPHWLKVDTGTTSTNWIKATTLKITSRSGATSQAPKTFQLLGSDDDVTYTAIITVTGEPAWSAETRTYAA